MVSIQDLDSDAINSLADQIAARLSAGKTPCTSITMGELFHKYFESHTKTRTKNEANTQYFWNAHGSRWASIQVHEIQQTDVQEWVDLLGGKSKSSATRAANMLNAIINWGLRRNLLPQIKNPVSGVEKFDIPARKRYLLPSELRKLKEGLDEEAPLYQDFFWMCLLTGARKGNVLSMRWDEIDLDLAIWTIPQHKFKNGDSHEVPLCKAAKAILARRKQESTSEWVFPGFPTKGRLPAGGESVGHLVDPKRAWNRVLDRSDLQNLHIHDLRRTLASWMALNGKNQYVIAQLLGHKDPRSTAIYARLNLDVVRNAADEVSEKYADVLTPQSDIKPVSDEAKPNHKGGDVKQFKNSSIRFHGADQIVVEARIISALKAGGNTKKHFYQKMGSRIKLNALELERILKDLEARKIISRHQTDNGVSYYSLTQMQLA